MRKIFCIVGFIFISMIIISSCEDEAQTKVVTEQDVKESIPVIEQNIDVQKKIVDVFENVNNIIDASGFNALKSGCDVPYVSNEGNVYTLDYSNVLNSSGTIVVEFSSEPSLLSLNLNATITFNSYVSEDIEMNGVLSLVVTPTLIGNINYELTSNETLSLESEGELFDWSCTYNILWESGVLTPDDFTDDVYTMSGSSTQILNGTSNAFIITEDLVYTNECDYVVSGVIQSNIQSNGEEVTLLIDYGTDAEGNASDSCDAYATITAGDIFTQVEL